MALKRLSVFLFLICSISIWAKPETIDPEEPFKERILAIKSGVDLIYSDEVKDQIQKFLQDTVATKKMLIRAKKYLPQIEKALRAKNLPIELKYLPAAATQLEPLYQNTTGESGMWMMMYNVAKMYKGKMNSYVDERRDPSRSTQIAVTHLKDLYAIYYQWPLAIAAYGASPYVVNKAIRRAENSMFFGDIYPYLPATNRDLYPRFVATVYIFRYFKEHGFRIPSTPEKLVELDSALVNKWLSFEQISNTINISVDQVRALNPIFKKDIIPFTADGYWIYFPLNKKEAFELLRDSVYHPHTSSTSFEPVVIAIDTNNKDTATANSAIVKPPPPKFDKKRIYYTVKKGDVLNEIARWFDVSVDEIRSWNKLKGSRINRGQRLAIWVKASKSGYYKKINTMSSQQKKRLK
jgi:membrane-bound lytic murein transglycosylase D